MVRAPSKHGAATPRPLVRVAAYCRQSVADELEFHSVAAQAEAIAAYVLSRTSDNWKLIPAEYRDRGFSGGSVDRPGYQRMLADIEADAVDVIVVHRLDRISRSLPDFVAFIALLDRHNVGFVAVTQAFDTTTSIGRLTMHLLGCFSEFERACISERTRAKIVATRQKGQWTGGSAILGFDVVDKALVPNDLEACTVNEIFAAFLRCGSLRQTLKELERRGIRTKMHVTKRGARTGGQPFSKSTLHHLLSNPLLIGKMPCNGEVFPGRHPPIVDESVWDAVQQRLGENARASTAEFRNRHAALLRGLAFCGVCTSPMRHDAARRGNRVYRFYSCSKQQIEGAGACPGSRCSAHDLERFVLDRVRGIGADSTVFNAAADAARSELDLLRPALTAQVRRLESERRRSQSERDGLLAAAAENPTNSAAALDRVAEIDRATPTLDVRLSVARDELMRIDSRAIDLVELREQLIGFDSLFQQLTPPEQCRLIALVIERVDVDVPRAAIKVTFWGAAPAQQSRTTT